jgi:hypothetical protein
MSYVAYGLPSIYNDPGIFVASEGTRTATISSDGIVRIWEEREDQLLLINEIECIEMKDPVGCVWIDDDILVVASEELAIGICASDGTIAYEIETNDAAVSLTSVGSLFALSFRDGVIAVIEGQDGTLLWRNRLRFFSSKRIPVLKASDRAVLVCVIFKCILSLSLSLSVHMHTHTHLGTHEKQYKGKRGRCNVRTYT